MVSLTDAVNTTSAQVRLMFNLFASLAEFKRELIRERNHIGLASVLAQGRMGGRRRGISEGAERTAFIAETLYHEQQFGINEIAQRLHILKSLLISTYATATVSSTRTVTRQLAKPPITFGPNF